MPRIMRTRGSTESYWLNSSFNYYAPSSRGYCPREKEEILRELSSNVMDKMYQRDGYSIRRTYSSWQMSK
jgi:hypothetical protein